MSTSIRPAWSSNVIYILAAIGCAAGVGNIWRFPMMAYSYGGGAFLLALLVSNAFIIFPLMMTETVLGQEFRLSGPQAFNKIKPGSAWIGWMGVLVSLFVLVYYIPLMAWAVKYLFLAFTGDFLVDPTTYFDVHILNRSASISDMGGFQWSVLAALLLCYAVIMFSLRKGVHSLGNVVKWTATLPFVLLFILVIRGVTLPGAMTGLEALFIPDWSQLKDLELWQAAIGQSFFSASLAFGYFMVAGSHRPKDHEIARSSLWIIIGNLMVSILSGMAVFSTLGFMAHVSEKPISEVAAGGPSLIFTVLPAAMAQMPFASIFFTVLLLIVFIMLAIDSAFGLFEVVVGAFHDLFPKKTYKESLRNVMIFIFILSLPLMTGAGFYYLDIIDHFIGTYLIMFIGMLEAFMMAYFIGPEKIRNLINKREPGKGIGKWFNIALYIIPLLLLTIIIPVFKQEFTESYEDYSMFYIVVLGLIPLAIVFIGSFFLSSQTEK
ncbi:sodium-dependent transporter [Candidatus Peregrinibacteria bacterium]|nr:MAG: sodium-dependent transporter [Candidatus Peregrinibacteria bacterium]